MTRASKLRLDIKASQLFPYQEDCFGNLVMGRDTGRWCVDLVKGVSAGSPPGKEQTETDGLENSRDGSNGNSVKRSLLGKDLADELQRPKRLACIPVARLGWSGSVLH
jgi:hypothetical protein